MFNCKVSSISTLIQTKDHIKTCMHNSMQITPAKVSTLHHYFCCVVSAVYFERDMQSLTLITYTYKYGC